MKKDKIKLALMILESTTAFKCNHLEIIEDSEDLRVYSRNHEQFFSLEIVAHLNNILRCYFDYDQERKQVYLRVYTLDRN